MIQPEQVPEAVEELRPYMTQIVEAQLKDYGESANAGCWVSFRLPSPEDLEVYRGMDRSGRNARSGKRYTLMVIALSDHDLPERAMEEKRPMKLSQLSGAVCHDKQFWQWLQETYEFPCGNQEQAADFLRQTCGVESRAMLDTNPEAAELFRDLLRDFDGWKAGNADQA